MTVRRHKSVAVAAAVLVLLIGLPVVILRRDIRACLQSTEGFRPLGTEPRVLYEPGAEAVAGRVAASVGEAVRRVEFEHHRPFVQPVLVYTCSTQDSFTRFTATGKAAGVVFFGKLFLNGAPLAKFPERVAPILTHELSHLHFSQQLGPWKYLRNIPGWFREGFAAYVSGGGGAEVSEGEATDDLLAKEHFIPVLEGNVFYDFRSIFTKTKAYETNPRGKAADVRIKSLYRQAMMFIGYLKGHDPDKFEKLLLSLEDGVAFREAWGKFYTMNIDVAWERFLASRREKRGERTG